MAVLNTQDLQLLVTESGSAVRDTQELALLATSANPSVRDSQDLMLLVEQRLSPHPINVRDSQDLFLLVEERLAPHPIHVRDTQEVMLVITKLHGIDISPTSMRSVSRIWAFEPRVDELYPDKVTVTVTASDAWTASPDVPWLRVTQQDSAHALVEVISSDSSPINDAGTYTGTVTFRSGEKMAVLSVTYIVSPLSAPSMRFYC